MKNILFTLALLIPVVSCGEQTKSDKKNQILKPSIQIPEGYTSMETIGTNELYFLQKNLEDNSYVTFSIDFIDDDVFSLISNEAYVNNAISEEGVSNWVDLMEESENHRQSIKYTFNSVGTTLMRQGSNNTIDEPVLYTIFQFVRNGKLFTCAGRSVNTDKEYFDDYVVIMESMKF